MQSSQGYGCFGTRQVGQERKVLFAVNTGAAHVAVREALGQAEGLTRNLATIGRMGLVRHLAGQDRKSLLLQSNFGAVHVGHRSLS